MNKICLSLIGILMITHVTIAQHQEERYLMKVDSLWMKEVFPLPTGFAQEMTLEGFEEAIFPPGWSKKESPQFWSYIFAWSVANEKPSTLKTLENNLEIYFDGLMGVPKDTLRDPKLPTTALLVETSNSDGQTQYSGKVRTYDNFRSKKMMTLHVKATQYACSKEEKAVIVFRFSPREFDDAVWDYLGAIPIRDDYCTHQ